jgi:hypothetical protein
MEKDLIILIVSGTLFVMGLYLFQKAKQLINHGKIAKGIIFKNNFESSSSGGGLYYPVVKFKTENNEWITQELSTGYRPKKREGKEIEVIYDPENPETVEINSFFQLKILPIIFLIIGLSGLVIGVLEYVEITNFIQE